MITRVSHSTLRQSLLVYRPIPIRRLLSTAPPAQKSRSWKSSAVRWGIAIGGLYYYNTSNVFAEQPALTTATDSIEDSSLPTLDSISSSRRSKFSNDPPIESLPPPSAPSASATTADSPEPVSLDGPPRTPEEYEEEAGQQGAFNEETGEINWDCPCLGGMAHGPCGEQFRAAFSCFVFSKEEPKGMDCIDRFKGMQDCFRDHPDVYGAELEEEDDKPADKSVQLDNTNGEQPNSPLRVAPPDADVGKTRNIEEDAKERAKAANAQVREDHGTHEAPSESDSLVPKAAHDATVPDKGM